MKEKSHCGDHKSYLKCFCKCMTGFLFVLWRLGLPDIYFPTFSCSAPSHVSSMLFLPPSNRVPVKRSTKLHQITTFDGGRLYAANNATVKTELSQSGRASDCWHSACPPVANHLRRVMAIYDLKVHLLVLRSITVQFSFKARLYLQFFPHGTVAQDGKNKTERGRWIIRSQPKHSGKYQLTPAVHN
jgi:hypothetical protein